MQLAGHLSRSASGLVVGTTSGGHAQAERGIAQPLGAITSAVVQQLEDPTRDALTRPAGYAGDARTLDYVYLRDRLAAGRSSDGRCSTSARACRLLPRGGTDAWRWQRSHASAHGDPRSPLPRSHAGHARELTGFPDTLDGIQFWGIDQDAKSIDLLSVSHRLGPRDVRGRVGSRRHRGPIRIPQPMSCTRQDSSTTWINAPEACCSSECSRPSTSADRCSSRI